jgi:hypothetical protein
MSNYEIIDRLIEKDKERLKKEYGEFHMYALAGNLQARLSSMLTTLEICYPSAYEKCVQDLK